MRVQVTQYCNDKIAALRVNPAGVDPEDDNSSDEEQDDKNSSNKRIKLDGQLAVAPEGTELTNRILPPSGYAYGNASVLRCNAMKFLSNFFEKGQVSYFTLHSLQLEEEKIT